VLSRVSVYNLFEYDKRSVRFKKFQITCLCVQFENIAIKTTTGTSKSINRRHQKPNKLELPRQLKFFVFKAFWIHTSRNNKVVKQIQLLKSVLLTLFGRWVCIFIVFNMEKWNIPGCDSNRTAIIWPEFYIEAYEQPTLIQCCTIFVAPPLLWNEFDPFVQGMLWTSFLAQKCIISVVMWIKHKLNWGHQVIKSVKLLIFKLCSISI